MLEPIMEPITIIVASNKPRPRTSFVSGIFPGLQLSQLVS